MTEQVVHVRVNDAATGRPTPVRVRWTAPDGRTLAPLGWLDRIPPGGRLSGGNVVIDGRLYAATDGAFEIRLPAGPSEVEITKGPEYQLIRQAVRRNPGQIALRFTIERRRPLDGWAAGDTRAFRLSPHAACLEGAAEGLAVVNVLAAKEPDGLIHGIAEFSGQAPAAERLGCRAVVNTQSRDAVWGTLSLLHCHRVVHPLDLAEEGFEAYALLDCSRQCHRKGGLVVWPDFPGCADDGPGEAWADLVAGGVDAVEWAAGRDFAGEGLARWYELLTAGFRVPLVGGSGKADGPGVLGAVRTYAQVGTGEPFTDRAWFEAVRAGRTFATAGPLLELDVGGAGPGGVLEPGTLPPAPAARVRARNAQGRLELVADGEPLGAVEVEEEGSLEVALPLEKRPAWVAARCWGGEGLAAHTSPVYLAWSGGAASARQRDALGALGRRLGELRERIARRAAGLKRDRLQAVVAEAEAVLSRL
jgi:hypothetical protein